MPRQFDGAGGVVESSMAQNGIDHTKSADVAVCFKPAAPCGMGGVPAKDQNQLGSGGPMGAFPPESKPALLAT